MCFKIFPHQPSLHFPWNSCIDNKEKISCPQPLMTFCFNPRQHPHSSFQKWINFLFHNIHLASHCVSHVSLYFQQFPVHTQNRINTLLLPPPPSSLILPKLNQLHFPLQPSCHSLPGSYTYKNQNESTLLKPSRNLASASATIFPHPFTHTYF